MRKIALIAWGAYSIIALTSLILFIWIEDLLYGKIFITSIIMWFIVYWYLILTHKEADIPTKGKTPVKSKFEDRLRQLAKERGYDIPDKGM